MAAAISPRPVAADGEPVSSGLLSYYGRLRSRVEAYVEKRGGRLGPAAAETLLLAPDLVVLLLRLTVDREVPGSVRSLAGGALLYFVVPVDLMPEVLVGPAGFLDDVVLAAGVLAELLQRDMEPWLDRHWSGSRRLRLVLRDVALSASWLLGGGLYERVRRKLGGWGVEL